MKPFSIAGIQTFVSANHENLTRLSHQIDTLLHVHPWVQMVLLSELAAHGPLLEHAEPVGGPTERKMCQIARQHGIWLIPGSFYVRENKRIYNQSPVIGPDGEVVARYRKLFPFLPYEERVEAGSEFVLFDVPDVGRFGMSICYDMWFPETTRTLAAMGAEVILHPSLTNTIDRELELSIARASAITNQCFFFDINGLGDGGVGRSIVVGPAGDVIHQAGSGEETIPVEIDLARVRRSREFGLRGLGQVLKSFRDRKIEFGIYNSDGPTPPYLETLGPLTKPTRGTRAGLDVSEA